MPVGSDLIDIFAPESGGEYIGAVSNFVGAALQTAGLYLQSAILRDSQPFLRGLGMLVWMASVVLALYSMAVQGSVRRGVLFLISPALFFFVLQTTYETDGTRVQVGKRIEGKASDQLKILEAFGNPDLYKEKANVSFAFAKFDAFVSGTVQTLVGFLLDEDRKQDLVAVSREAAFTRMMAGRSTEAGYITLLSQGFLGSCAEYFRRTNELAELQKEQAFVQNLVASGSANNGRLPVIQSRIAQLSGSTGEIAKLQTKTFNLDLTTQDFVWSLGLDAARRDFMTCGELWKYIAVASQKTGMDTYLAATQGKSGSPIPWTMVRDEIRVSIGGSTSASDADVARIVGAYILRNTLSALPNEQIASRTFSSTPFNATLSNYVFGYWSQPDAVGSMSGIAYYSGVIRYVQGIILFVASALFPFFAVALLSPNHFGAFFGVLGVFAWAKSWDVGFALIHFIRDLLWTYLARNSAPVPAQMDWNSPDLIFRIANDYDPTANQSTYYGILAILTFAVPVVTAHFFKGAGNVLGSLRGMTDDPSNKIQQATMKRERRKNADTHEQKLMMTKALAGLERANKFADSGGGKTLDGIPRNQTGDGAFAREIGLEKDKGVADAIYNEAFESNQFLAMETGRPTMNAATAGSTEPYMAQKLHREKIEPRSADYWYNHGSNTVTAGQPGGRGITNKASWGERSMPSVNSNKVTAPKGEGGGEGSGQ